MRSLLNKKSAVIRVLSVLCLLVLALFAVSLGKGEEVSASANQSYYILDADQLSFEGKADVAKKDADNLLMSGKDNYVLQSNVTKTSPTLKLSASAYGDRIYGGTRDAVKIELKLLFNKWPDVGYGGFSNDATYIALAIYNSDDTKFENPIARVEEYTEIGNFVRTFQLLPNQICNNRGKLQDIVLRVESDASSWLSAVIVDYVKIVFEASPISYAGDCAVGKNPAGLTDENVVWTEAKGYCDTYIDLANYGGFYGYVSNPAVVELQKNSFPQVECITEENGTETLLLKNAVFALNVGNLSVDDYAQFVMDILLTDKRAKGGHTLYLYGSNVEKFVDEDGSPVGYAAEVIVESYEQGFHNKFILEKEDIHKLADENGIVSNIYILYHGNTLDTEDETFGLCNGSQIWMNKIQFLEEGEMETPTLAVKYDKYDAAELFPVGEGVTLQNKSVATSGDMISHAALANKPVGEFSLAVTMNGGDNVTVLFNALGLKQVNEYLDGGILFYLSNGKIEISAHVDGAMTKAISVIPQTSFSTKKIVKLECIPYYLNSVETGLYCAVSIDGEVVLSDYFLNDNLCLGNVFHLGYQAQDKDFTATIGSSKTSDVMDANALMNVKIKAEKIYYSLDQTDIPLALSWYDTGYDEVSEVGCVSEVATVNQEVRRIEFTDNGEAKIRFSITNAFGTFESNELSLECQDVVVIEEDVKEFYENEWFIVLYFLPIAAFVIVVASVVIKKQSSRRK